MNKLSVVAILIYFIYLKMNHLFLFLIPILILNLIILLKKKVYYL